MFRTHGLDALVFPTTASCAASVDDDSGMVAVCGEPMPVFDTYVRNTCPGNVVGLPGLTVPIPRPAGGLPVGLGLDGWCGTDRALLGVGMLVQKLLAQG